MNHSDEVTHELEDDIQVIVLQLLSERDAMNLVNPMVS